LSKAREEAVQRLPLACLFKPAGALPARTFFLDRLIT
jgi:hypothetical protein